MCVSKWHYCFGTFNIIWGRLCVVRGITESPTPPLSNSVINRTSFLGGIFVEGGGGGEAFQRLLRVLHEFTRI